MSMIQIDLKKAGKLVKNPVDHEFLLELDIEQAIGLRNFLTKSIRKIVEAAPLVGACNCEEPIIEDDGWDEDCGWCGGIIQAITDSFGCKGCGELLTEENVCCYKHKREIDLTIDIQWYYRDGWCKECCPMRKRGLPHG